MSGHRIKMPSLISGVTGQKTVEHVRHNYFPTIIDESSDMGITKNLAVDEFLALIELNNL